MPFKNTEGCLEDTDSPVTRLVNVEGGLTPGPRFLAGDTSLSETSSPSPLAQGEPRAHCTGKKRAL